MFILKNLRFDMIEMSVHLASDISQTIKEAIAIAKTYHCSVSFTFNDVQIVIDSGAVAESVLSDFYKREKRSASV